MKRSMLVLVMVCLIGSFAALGAQESNPVYGGILKVGILQEILNIDPHVATGFASFRVIEQIYEGLVGFDAGMNLKPILSESWTISPDGTEYVFHLREGVKFHNGRVLTAEDVKYTYERVLNPDTASPQASHLKAISEITVLSPTAIKITLDEPSASFLSTLALIRIVPEDFPTLVQDPKTETLGTGPFMLKEFGIDFVALEKNNAYWGTDSNGRQLPYLDEVVIQVIPDPTTLMAAIRAGEVDLALGLDAIMVEILNSAQDLNIIAVPELTYGLMGLNNSREPFTDTRVRQAISLAIDRQEIVDIVYFGEATVGGPLPPSVGEWNPLPASELPNYKQNIAKARQLLVEAGYPDGFSFKLVPVPTVPECVKMAQVIQEQLKDVNIAVEIESADFSTFLNQWRNSDFDAFVSLNGGSTDPDIHLYRHLHSSGGTNQFKYSDHVTDLLLEAGQLATEPSIRRDIYAALQRRLAKQVPFIFTSYANLYAVERNEVKGFVLLSNRTNLLRETWVQN